MWNKTQTPLQPRLPTPHMVSFSFAHGTSAPSHDCRDCKEDRGGDSQCPGVTVYFIFSCPGPLSTSWRFHGQGSLACLSLCLSTSLPLTGHSLISCLLVPLSVFMPSVVGSSRTHTLFSPVFHTLAVASLFPGLRSPYLKQHTSQDESPTISVLCKAEEGGGPGEGRSEAPIWPVFLQ